jgi:hypothetical protein
MQQTWYSSKGRRMPLLLWVPTGFQVAIIIIIIMASQQFEYNQLSLPLHVYVVDI